jgi:hypothetical protein
MGIEGIESCAWKCRNRLCPAAARYAGGERGAAACRSRFRSEFALAFFALFGFGEEREGNVRACQSKGCLHASLTFPSFLVWPAGSPTCTLRGTNQRPTRDQPGTSQGLWMHVLSRCECMQQPSFHLSRLTANAKSPCNLAFHEDET